MYYCNQYLEWTLNGFSESVFVFDVYPSSFKFRNTFYGDVRRIMILQYNMHGFPCQTTSFQKQILYHRPIPDFIEIEIFA